MNKSLSIAVVVCLWSAFTAPLSAADLTTRCSFREAEACNLYIADVQVLGGLWPSAGEANGIIFDVVGDRNYDVVAPGFDGAPWLWFYVASTDPAYEYLLSLIMMAKAHEFKVHLVYETAASPTGSSPDDTTNGNWHKLVSLRLIGSGSR
jgi:hypothetical protein